MTPAQPTRNFNSLPKELRDMIWDAVVRDDLPAAHFFSVSARENILDVDDDDDCVIFGYSDGPARDRPSFISSKRISAPTAGRKERELFAWTANNPSMYLRDGGLWTACHESRAAVERSQRKRDWAVATHPPRGKIHCNNHKSMSGYFTNNGVRQYFAIGLNDLVCFQPVRDYTFDFAFGMPFFHGIHWQPCSPQHFAFEFDSNWTYPEDLPSHEWCWMQRDILGCIANALISEGTHIWLIDYGIQRDTSCPNNSDIRDNRQVFYGSACRYVEVQCSDREWEYPRLEGSNLPARATALYFAEQLDEYMKLYERLDEYDMTLDSSAFSMEIETRSGATLGVLACEYKW